MRRRGLPAASEAVATVATTAVLVLGTALLLAIHPAAALAWLASSAVMSWRVF